MLGKNSVILSILKLYFFLTFISPNVGPMFISLIKYYDLRLWHCMIDLNLNSAYRRKIKTNINQCRYIKKLTCKGTLRQVFIYLRPPPLLDFCLGWCSNFVGSEFGQKQSLNSGQNMVSNTT